MRRVCVETALKKNDFKIRECLVWEKNTWALGRQDYQWQHEPCLEGEVNAQEENPIWADPRDEITIHEKALYGWKEGGAHIWNGGRKQSTILKFSKPVRNEEHPTMKPVAMFDQLIKNSSYKGDIVLDTFAGSGTTIIVAEQDGRTAYCMEIDPRYVDVIIDRYESFTGEKARKCE